MIVPNLTCEEIISKLTIKFGYSQIDTSGYGIHIVYESTGNF